MCKPGQFQKFSLIFSGKILYILHVFCILYILNNTLCISLHDHSVSFQDSNCIIVMAFDSIHMYSHILVGVGQSVLYQCTQLYMCTHVHICDVSVCMQACVCVCKYVNVYIYSMYTIRTSWMYTTYSLNCIYHFT